MRLKIKPTALMLLALATASCDFDKGIKVDLPVPPDAYFVEAYLEDSMPARVAVTFISGYFDSLGIRIPQRASVTLTTPQGDINLLQGIFPDPYNFKLYNFITPSRMQIQDNENFSIRIADDSGRVVTGTARAMPVIKIDSVTIGKRSDVIDSARYLSVWFNDPAGITNYYRLVINQDSSNGGAATEYSTEDNVRDGGQISLTTSYRYKLGDSIMVRLYHIDQEYRNFLQSVASAERSNGNPFSQPAPIKSNVQGGMGIFTVLRGDVKRFRIKE